VNRRNGSVLRFAGGLNQGRKILLAASRLGGPVAPLQDTAQLIERGAVFRLEITSLLQVRNRVARSLVARRTFMVGLVIPDLMHSFFAEVAKGVAKKLEPLGYQIVIADSEESAETEERQIELLLARNLDGLIIASSAGERALELFPIPAFPQDAARLD
jgi:ABC-type sugar transport system substrate-binding protein